MLEQVVEEASKGVEMDECVRGITIKHFNDLKKRLIRLQSIPPKLPKGILPQPRLLPFINMLPRWLRRSKAWVIFTFPEIHTKRILHLPFSRSRSPDHSVSWITRMKLHRSSKASKKYNLESIHTTLQNPQKLKWSRVKREFLGFGLLQLQTQLNEVHNTNKQV